jgi:hypothetical protein
MQFYLYTIVEKFSSFGEASQCAPAPNGGRVGARGSDPNLKRGFLQSRKNPKIVHAECRRNAYYLEMISHHNPEGFSNGVGKK